MVELYRKFHSQGKVSRALNSTSTTLIRKKAEANRIQDFWPFSVIFTPYMTIAKVLWDRLQQVRHDAIDGNQYAFIKGRHILDSIFIANE